ncbi:unnamed protein product [Owenia fusiformis]|uniref:BTB domain-containing protein n=1 Tax=Owenia fusiformis TaxID=6347 RepID=A0A8S4PW72_OWEFU|nr:unnamed protein product [Owenia fusiformis]
MDEMEVIHLVQNKRFQSCISDMQENHELCDVSLQLPNGVTIQVHKLVIAASSAMFKGICSEAKLNSQVTISLKEMDISVPYMKKVIDFMYGRVITIKASEIEEYLRIAKSLRMKPLERVISSVTEEQEAIKAEQADSKKLSKRCLQKKDMTCGSHAQSTSTQEASTGLQFQDQRETSSVVSVDLVGSQSDSAGTDTPEVTCDMGDEFNDDLIPPSAIKTEPEPEHDEFEELMSTMEAETYDDSNEANDILDYEQFDDDVIDPDYEQIDYETSDVNDTLSDSAAEGSSQFSSVTDSYLDDLIKEKVGTEKKSRSTQRTMKRSIETFRKYCSTENFEDFSKAKLNQLMCKFFAGLKTQQGGPYKRSSLISMKYGLGKHLMKKQIDINRDPEFLRFRDVFNGILAKNKKQGLSSVSHKPPISKKDIQKLYSSGVFNEETPSGLLYKTWFEIQYYICSRGHENLRSMTRETFKVSKDEYGREYVHEALVTDGETAAIDRRMYAYPIGVPNCPVATFKKYISKLNNGTEALWQRPQDNQVVYADDVTWFHRTPLGHHTLGSMMRLISGKAKLSTTYTNLSIRATKLAGIALKSEVHNLPIGNVVQGGSDAPKLIFIPNRIVQIAGTQQQTAPGVSVLRPLMSKPR